MVRTSLERILAVLELFTEDRLEWTPEAMMAALGYSRPTLYRYLKALREAGFVAALPGRGCTLGPRVVEMDYLMRRSDALVRAGRPHLERLAADRPCTALLVRWYGNRILCVDSVCSTPNPLSSYPRGRPMPLARGAISRSIMAFLPRRRLAELIERNLEELRAIGLGRTPADILERFRDVRRAGYAVAHGEVTPGVVGIAAPVFDAARAPVASLCTTVAAPTIGPGEIERIGAEVRAAAADVSARLDDRRGGTSERRDPESQACESCHASENEWESISRTPTLNPG
jgi:DNA-binding IclR family transcriptional regulator